MGCRLKRPDRRGAPVITRVIVVRSRTVPLFCIRHCVARTGSTCLQERLAMRNFSQLTTALWLIVFSIGCGTSQQATPQATFDNYKASAARADWPGIFAFVTPKSQDSILGAKLIWARYI